ncbi:Integrase, catalytic region (plasmid) [Deinococcus geothermalis DSM 11300]|uniref:Integrase, catalytic region n=1 Tax=Deinococcus geothermalis (strain DSM 11300 / CIP 105573 / AG-3a) TaxID=319795 RepID=Q1J3G2_DEIGD|nr:Integrase, catalytic region [Deinococcus geothermalis DSM 11300]
MLGGAQVRRIIELKAAGHTVSGIARQLDLSRNTVKKYLREPALPQPKPRPKKGSKLDPYVPYLKGRIEQGVLSAVVLFREVQERGYQGQYTVVKDFVRPFRRTQVSAARVTTRFETAPGEQAQVDFGRYSYLNLEGQTRSIWAFVMVLGWSRALYVEFIRKADTASFIRCHLNAFAYFGGMTQSILYDNTKQVVLERDETGQPVWNPQFLDFSLRLGFSIRLCRPYRPRTKGKVESGVGYVEKNFWLGAKFVDDADLNRQARHWLDHVANVRTHGTTRQKPLERLALERPTLKPLPSLESLRCSCGNRARSGGTGSCRMAGTSTGSPGGTPGRPSRCRPTTWKCRCSAVPPGSRCIPGRPSGGRASWWKRNMTACPSLEMMPRAAGPCWRPRPKAYRRCTSSSVRWRSTTPWSPSAPPSRWTRC